MVTCLTHGDGIGGRGGWEDGGRGGVGWGVSEAKERGVSEYLVLTSWVIEAFDFTPPLGYLKLMCKHTSNLFNSTGLSSTACITPRVKVGTRGN